ncbi:tRNA uridine-5-carboxymethylaminomethyl(34) synthesis enzyme MnmG [Desulfuromonas acetoxidans]|uniref:tRNA uridine 5-carboxymethylaminomethyl modification enzyme MnmG n=1 Tax=Desulfuromonas acetoxidans (strain DSM 684 / 11070) TaxID=281689 RepID=Q1JZF9_DESA6|nr:tRNA uridine-5-carboxymethylaminomethyl(34) synthesis enzyme MnmG [Desulfuromonas acetoxidans]EAT15608.1 glucose inhibited division protein A [Desulfuromonas acetoxidans DSM 684]MBF0645765.1 tRNA uridine-5-carboxymethylaminomethyl(34) synthesis enzyme MnmG [Desulfuromonas acetoxidans]NVD25201.1 tRNA uridine-5-carboxymethylaminomethyl(34) synthesis enzyme MnmG [Desulfuromonas acetoxidans]NVE17177.1 tRNA uridine-5-carboxymethylaminomethyl(34) synthesis enzyme MnmG [Desulfuromonas acetoxidans]
MIVYDKKYEVVVVGAGHAGCEAALAAARMGHETLLLNMNLDAVAQMSCNPAIGGLAKGHLVREIDALGGQMAKNIDKTGIQFRVLNTKKGPAVQASRAQADRFLYSQSMKLVVENQEKLDLKQGTVSHLVVEENRIVAVEIKEGWRFNCQCVVLTTGTFMRGLIHVGMNHYPGGRSGEPPSLGLSDQLKKLGFDVGRLKTGTPPRLYRGSIDFSKTEEQPGDDTFRPFSYVSEQVNQQQVSCYITATNEQTHEIIRSGLDRSPLYSGVIEGVGPRYCPSIEDKVVRFPEKTTHQVFLEPEGLNSSEIYPNGLPTSLPADVQLKFLRTIPGLENVEIMRVGYAIEYDYVDPIQLKPSLETKLIDGLFHAGQVNGTSGYEEAAAQGLMAGINAVRKIEGKPPVILRRDQAYIGVLIDDLINLGSKEPYRMFTSRAEYRLLLREDNADERLTELGYQVGLVDEQRWKHYSTKKKHIDEALKLLVDERITAKDKDKIAALNVEKISNGQSAKDLLKRPNITIAQLKGVVDGLDAYSDEVLLQVEIAVKYDGYIKRQNDQVEKFKKNELVKIPETFDYTKVQSLSAEVIEKLCKIRPENLGQASRIPGVTPAAITILSVLLRGRNDH